MASSSSTQRGIAERIDYLKKQVDATLAQAIPNRRGPEWIARRALRYSVLTAGHRWRPILFLTLLEGMKRPYRRYLMSAVGLELIHSSTLIIDDLPFVDNADIRRNKPCCHVRFGVDVAAYASHLGFDVAESLMLGNAPSQFAKVLSDKLRKLKETLIVGQCLERALCSGEIAATPENLHRQYVLKSGALFEFGAEFVALLTKLEVSAARALKQFGEEVGVAYQIADDLADVSASPFEIGKRASMDVGKANYARTLGTQFATKMLKMHHDRSVALLEALFAKRVLVQNRSLLIGILQQLHHD